LRILSRGGTAVEMLNKESQKVLKCFPVLIEKSLYASEHFAVLFMALIAPTGLLARRKATAEELGARAESAGSRGRQQVVVGGSG
jgi:hypothetical protein